MSQDRTLRPRMGDKVSQIHPRRDFAGKHAVQQVDKVWVKLKVWAIRTALLLPPFLIQVFNKEAVIGVLLLCRGPRVRPSRHHEDQDCGGE